MHCIFTFFPSFPRFSLSLEKVQRPRAKQSVRTKVFFSVPDMKTKQMFRTFCFAQATSLAAGSENILAPKLVPVLFISSWAPRSFQSHPLQTTHFFFFFWAGVYFVLSLHSVGPVNNSNTKKNSPSDPWKGSLRIKIKIAALIQKAKGLGRERKAGVEVGVGEGREKNRKKKKERKNKTF